MKDFGSFEDRVRQPVRGLRQRLRVALRAAGFMAKFRTDHARNGTLLVMIRAQQGPDGVLVPGPVMPLPLCEFEGHPVKLARSN